MYRAVTNSEEYPTLCCGSVPVGRPNPDFDLWDELDLYGLKRRLQLIQPSKFVRDERAGPLLSVTGEQIPRETLNRL